MPQSLSFGMSRKRSISLRLALDCSQAQPGLLQDHHPLMACILFATVTDPPDAAAWALSLDVMGPWLSEFDDSPVSVVEYVQVGACTPAASCQA